ncbi:MAG: hypothetical protein AAF493_00365 [Pseudomonadota bacterium]
MTTCGAFDANERVGIVCALEREAALLKPVASSQLIVDVCGPGPHASAESAKRLVGDGVKVLMSFGLAGGLDPALGAGTIVVPRAVVYRSHTYRMEPKRHGACCARLTRAPITDHLLTVAEPLTSASAKATGRVAPELCAVDMETGALAQVATDAGCAWLAVRAICDDAATSFPRWLAAHLQAHAQPPGALAALRGIARRPSDLPSTLRLAGADASARRALRWVAIELGLCHAR